jgi:hypothetical protein
VKAQHTQAAKCAQIPAPILAEEAVGVVLNYSDTMPFERNILHYIRKDILIRVGHRFAYLYLRMPSREMGL